MVKLTKYANFWCSSPDKTSFDCSIFNNETLHVVFSHNTFRFLFICCFCQDSILTNSQIPLQIIRIHSSTYKTEIITNNTNPIFCTNGNWLNSLIHIWVNPFYQVFVTDIWIVVYFVHVYSQWLYTTNNIDIFNEAHFSLNHVCFTRLCIMC